MKKEFTLELGETYIVTLPDRMEIEFTILGGEPIMAKTSDGQIELYKLFSQFLDIRKK